MLTDLSIRNFLLIESLDLEVGPGLTVLSGETGAGKSILLDALGLIMGDRATADVVRQGATSASITAIFQGKWNSELQEKFPGEELIVRRTITAEGKSRAFINDMPVTLQELKNLSFIEIHGQFDTLFDAAFQQEALDLYGGLLPLREDVAEAYRHWREAETAYEEASNALQQIHKEEAFLRFSQQELQDLAPQEDEETDLLARRLTLINQEKIHEGVSQAIDMLYAVQQKIFQGEKSLQRILEWAPSLSQTLESFHRILLELEEAEAPLKALGHTAYDETLDSLEGRLGDLRTAARKYGVSVAELPALLIRMEKQLMHLESSDENLKFLEEVVREKHETYLSQAHSLSQARDPVITKLEKAVASALPKLKLGEGRFKVEKEPLEKGTKDGLERLHFMVALNPGSPFGNVEKIASGGERSRLLLILKALLAHCHHRDTLIFDEIDTGTGGAVADGIGGHLLTLSQERQVLVITHSPQVASKGTSHWRVHKSVKDGKTFTCVDVLTPEERQEEIARMLSGEVITPEARQAAQKLLSHG